MPAVGSELQADAPISFFEISSESAPNFFDTSAVGDSPSSETSIPPISLRWWGGCWTNPRFSLSTASCHVRKRTFKRLWMHSLMFEARSSVCPTCWSNRERLNRRRKCSWLVRDFLARNFDSGAAVDIAGLVLGMVSDHPEAKAMIANPAGHDGAASGWEDLADDSEPILLSGDQAHVFGAEGEDDWVSGTAVVRAIEMPLQTPDSGAMPFGMDFSGEVDAGPGTSASPGAVAGFGGVAEVWEDTTDTPQSPPLPHEESHDSFDAEDAGKTEIGAAGTDTDTADAEELEPEELAESDLYFEDEDVPLQGLSFGGPGPGVETALSPQGRAAPKDGTADDSSEPTASGPPENTADASVGALPTTAIGGKEKKNYLRR